MRTSRIGQSRRALLWISLVAGLCSSVSVGGFSRPVEAADPFFQNHFALLPGDPAKLKTTALLATSVGSGSPGLVIEPLAATVDSSVIMAMSLGRNTTVIGMRVCYELSNPRSFINRVRLTRVMDPEIPRNKNTANDPLEDPDELLQDQPQDLDEPTAHCASFKTMATTKVIGSEAGAIILSLGVHFANQSDKIVIRSLAVRIPSSAGGGF